MPEETKVVEMGTEMVANAPGNLKVVAVTAVATLAASAGVYFAVKKGKEAWEARKQKKASAKEKVPAKETKKK